MYSKTVLELAVTVGEKLLVNGCGTHRIEAEIKRTLSACNFTKSEVFITTSGVIVTIDSKETGLLTMVKHVHKKNMHTERIAYIEEIVTSFVNNSIDADTAIKEIINMATKNTYSFLVIALAFAGAGCFRTFMFGGTIYDALTSIAVGFCVGVFIQILTSIKMLSFLVTMCAGFIVGFVSVLLMRYGIGSNLDKIIVGSLISFAPGVPFVHAVNDILNGEHISGNIRAIEAILSGFAIASGIAFALYLWNCLGGGSVI
ncbi:MAG: threonine/serine exporter family protein [Lachnospiraceae bacterium]|nr:threonine/serine exporter family protein [Lachnospiraceae bacterium]